MGPFFVFNLLASTISRAYHMNNWEGGVRVSWSWSNLCGPSCLCLLHLLAVLHSQHFFIQFLHLSRQYASLCMPTRFWSCGNKNRRMIEVMSHDMKQTKIVQVLLWSVQEGRRTRRGSIGMADVVWWYELWLIQLHIAVRTSKTE